MAERVQTLENPMDRAIIQIELMKIFGGLRTDDSVNIVPLTVHLREDQKVIVGICSKTKSTERTASRITGGTPSRVPILPSLDHTEWWHGFQDNVRLTGVPLQAGHAIPKTPERPMRSMHREWPHMQTPCRTSEERWGP